MFRYALLTLFLFAMPAAASPDDDAAAALALAKPKKSATTAVEFNDYATGAAEAVARGCPLVTFVGTRPRALPGVSWCGTYKLTGYTAPCIVVSVPDGKGWLNEWIVLSPAATDAQITKHIKDALAPKAVSQAANPFSSVSALQPPTADDSLERGPWPAKLDFPDGMRRYKRATMTQEIAVTNDRDRITPVPRTVLEPKYHQSGGMLGLQFRSDVYRNDKRPREWVGDIQVKNSFGYYQPNRGWKREYPAGARFMDVLSNVDTGEVFEVRKLEKHGPNATDWYIFVDYEDAAQRPVGYTGKLGVTCGSCHGDAGQGNYAAGLVIGGDFVLSDPFPALER